MIPSITDRKILVYKSTLKDLKGFRGCGVGANKFTAVRNALKDAGIDWYGHIDKMHKYRIRMKQQTERAIKRRDEMMKLFEMLYK